MGAQHYHTFQLQLNNRQNSQINILSSTVKLRCHSLQLQSYISISIESQQHVFSFIALFCIMWMFNMGKKHDELKGKFALHHTVWGQGKINHFWVWRTRRKLAGHMKSNLFSHTVDVKKALKVDKRLSKTESRWGEIKWEKTCIFTTALWMTALISDIFTGQSELKQHLIMCWSITHYAWG